MGKSAPKQPKAPDPNYLSALQRRENMMNAKQHAAYSQVGVETPFASVHYTGEVGTPNRKKHITLSKPISDQMERDNTLHSQLQTHALNALNHMPTKAALPNLPKIQPIDEAAMAQREQALFNAGKTGLDKDFKASEKRLDIQLGQRGIPQTSKAYQKSMRALRKSRIDALSALSSRAASRARAETHQKFNQDVAWRNQKINESLIDSGEGLKRLNFAFSHLQRTTPGNYTRYLSHLGETGAGHFKPVDVAGNVQHNYRDQFAYQQAKDKYQNAFVGGLFNLGKTFL